MQRSILVTYLTKSGSTAEVAQAIGQELSGADARVDVRPLGLIDDLDAYDAIVVGAPMILGWHRDAVRFVEQNQQVLSQKPVAFFLTALSLTADGSNNVDGIPIYQDPSLAKPPKKLGKLSYRERYACASNYLHPALRAAPQVRPVSAGFFNGKLDLKRLDLLSRVFVQLIIGAKSGDFRNWDAIRSWAASLRPSFIGEQAAA